jgi:hypothetical protein
MRMDPRGPGANPEPKNQSTPDTQPCDEEELSLGARDRSQAGGDDPTGKGSRDSLLGSGPTATRD